MRDLSPVYPERLPTMSSYPAAQLIALTYERALRSDTSTMVARSFAGTGLGLFAKMRRARISLSVSPWGMAYLPSTCGFGPFESLCVSCRGCRNNGSGGVTRKLAYCRAGRQRFWMTMAPLARFYGVTVEAPNVLNGRRGKKGTCKVGKAQSAVSVRFGCQLGLHGGQHSQSCQGPWIGH